MDTRSSHKKADEVKKKNLQKKPNKPDKQKLQAPPVLANNLDAIATVMGAGYTPQVGTVQRVADDETMQLASVLGNQFMLQYLDEQESESQLQDEMHTQLEEEEEIQTSEEEEVQTQLEEEEEVQTQLEEEDVSTSEQSEEVQTKAEESNSSEEDAFGGNTVDESVQKESDESPSIVEEQPVQTKVDTSPKVQSPAPTVVPTIAEMMQFEMEEAQELEDIQMQTDIMQLLSDTGDGTEEDPTQAKSRRNKLKISEETTNKIKQQRGHGDPLPEDVLEEMEAAFGGEDFSDVRIHTDGNASELSTELGAKAFTNQEDIHFKSGQFDTSSSTGKHLLAHELTHVVQQRTISDLQTKLTDPSQRNHYEVEADRTADTIISGGQVKSSGVSQVSSAGGVQLEEGHSIAEEATFARDREVDNFEQISRDAWNLHNAIQNSNRENIFEVLGKPTAHFIQVYNLYHQEYRHNLLVDDIHTALVGDDLALALSMLGNHNSNWFLSDEYSYEAGVFTENINVDNSPYSITADQNEVITPGNSIKYTVGPFNELPNEINWYVVNDSRTNDVYNNRSIESKSVINRTSVNREGYGGVSLATEVPNPIEMDITWNDIGEHKVICLIRSRSLLQNQYYYAEFTQSVQSTNEILNGEPLYAEIVGPDVVPVGGVVSDFSINFQTTDQEGNLEAFSQLTPELIEFNYELIRKSDLNDELEESLTQGGAITTADQITAILNLINEDYQHETHMGSFWTADPARWLNRAFTISSFTGLPLLRAISENSEPILRFLTNTKNTIPFSDKEPGEYILRAIIRSNEHDYFPPIVAIKPLLISDPAEIANNAIGDENRRLMTEVLQQIYGEAEVSTFSDTQINNFSQILLTRYGDVLNPTMEDYEALLNERHDSHSVNILGDIADYRSRHSDIEENEFRIRAILTSDVTGQQYGLVFQAFFDYENKKVYIYDVSGLRDKEAESTIGNTPEEWLFSAFTNYGISENELGDGYISYRAPAGVDRDNVTEVYEGVVRNESESEWADVKANLQILATLTFAGLAIGGAILEPGVMGETALLTVAAASVTGILASERLIRNGLNEDIQWNTMETWMDILDIASAFLIVGAAGLGRWAKAVNEGSTLYIKLADLATIAGNIENTLDHVTVAALDINIAREYINIAQNLESGAITPADAEYQKSVLLMTALQSNLMYAVGQYGASRQRTISSRQDATVQLGRLNTELELSQHAQDPEYIRLQNEINETLTEVTELSSSEILGRVQELDIRFRNLENFGRRAGLTDITNTSNNVERLGIGDMDNVRVLQDPSIENIEIDLHRNPETGVTESYFLRIGRNATEADYHHHANALQQLRQYDGVWFRIFNHALGLGLTARDFEARVEINKHQEYMNHALDASINTDGIQSLDMLVRYNNYSRVYESYVEAYKNTYLGIGGAESYLQPIGNVGVRSDANAIPHGIYSYPGTSLSGANEPIIFNRAESEYDPLSMLRFDEGRVAEGLVPRLPDGVNADLIAQTSNRINNPFDQGFLNSQLAAFMSNNLNYADSDLANIASNFESGNVYNAASDSFVRRLSIEGKKVELDFYWENRYINFIERRNLLAALETTDSPASIRQLSFEQMLTSVRNFIADGTLTRRRGQISETDAPAFESSVSFDYGNAAGLSSRTRDGSFDITVSQQDIANGREQSSLSIARERSRFQGLGDLASMRVQSELGGMNAGEAVAELFLPGHIKLDMSTGGGKQGEFDAAHEWGNELYILENKGGTSPRGTREYHGATVEEGSFPYVLAMRDIMEARVNNMPHLRRPLELLNTAIENQNVHYYEVRQTYLSNGEPGDITITKYDLDYSALETQQLPSTQQKSESTTEKLTSNPEISSQIAASRGGGSPLPKNIQTEMEKGFGGEDFSGVRIHNNSKSSGLNKELGAKAFTNREDIHFNTGQFNPESQSGKHLLAHELTHVVQQRSVPNLQTKLEDPIQRSHYELEADRTADTIVNGGMVKSNGISQVSNAGGVQLQSENEKGEERHSVLIPLDKHQKFIRNESIPERKQKTSYLIYVIQQIYLVDEKTALDMYTNNNVVFEGGIEDIELPTNEDYSFGLKEWALVDKIYKDYQNVRSENKDNFEKLPENVKSQVDKETNKRLWEVFDIDENQSKNLTLKDAEEELKNLKALLKTTKDEAARKKLEEEIRIGEWNISLAKEIEKAYRAEIINESKKFQEILTNNHIISTRLQLDDSVPIEDYGQIIRISEQAKLFSDLDWKLFDNHTKGLSDDLDVIEESLKKYLEFKKTPEFRRFVDPFEDELYTEVRVSSREHMFRKNRTDIFNLPSEIIDLYLKAKSREMFILKTSQLDGYSPEEAGLIYSTIENALSHFRDKAALKAYDLMTQNRKLLIEERENYKDEKKLDKLISMIKGKDGEYGGIGPLFHELHKDRANVVLEFKKTLFDVDKKKSIGDSQAHLRGSFLEVMDMLNYAEKGDKKGLTKYFMHRYPTVESLTFENLQKLLTDYYLAYQNTIKGETPFRELLTADDVKAKIWPSLDRLRMQDDVNSMLLREYSNEFLIFKDISINWATLHGKPADKIKSEIKELIQTKIDNVPKARKQINEKKDTDHFWELEPLIMMTMAENKISGTNLSHIITEKVKARKATNTMRSLVLGVTGLVLGIMGAVALAFTGPVAGPIIAGVLAGASIVAGGAEAMLLWDRYTLHSVTKNIAVGEFGNLSSENIAHWEIGLVVLGMVFDAFDVVKGAKVMLSVTDAVEITNEARKAAKVINKNLHKISGDASPEDLKLFTKELHSELAQQGHKLDEAELLSEVEKRLKLVNDTKMTKNLNKVDDLFKNATGGIVEIDDLVRLQLTKMNPEFPELVQEIIKHVGNDSILLSSLTKNFNTIPELGKALNSAQRILPNDDFNKVLRYLGSIGADHCEYIPDVMRKLEGIESAPVISTILTDSKIITAIKNSEHSAEAIRIFKITDPEVIKQGLGKSRFITKGKGYSPEFIEQVYTVKYGMTWPNEGFGTYLEKIAGEAPEYVLKLAKKSGVKKHAHHILYKSPPIDWGDDYVRMWEEARQILIDNGINPTWGKENLVWAPNLGHSKENLKKVCDAIIGVDGLGKAALVDELEELGKYFSRLSKVKK